MSMFEVKLISFDFFFFVGGVFYFNVEVLELIYRLVFGYWMEKLSYVFDEV